MKNILNTENSNQIKADNFSDDLKAELILEVCTDCILDWNLTTGKIRLSPACSTMLGYSPEELSGSPGIWQSLIHKDDLPAVLKLYEQCIENLTDFFSIEFRIQTRSGEWLWILSRGKAVQRGPDQRAQRIITGHTDITEIKKSRQEVQDAYVMTKSILDSINAVITVVDLETHEILFINRSGRAIFGDIKGKKCWQVFQTGRTAPCNSCPNHKLMGENGYPAGIVRWKAYNRKSGKWFDCRDQAVKWMDGRMVKIQTAIDITDREQAEDNAAKEDTNPVEYSGPFWRPAQENHPHCLKTFSLEQFLNPYGSSDIFPS